MLTAALGHDVIMPCQLSLTDDKRIQTPPVLYWMYLTEGSSDESIVWSYSENYTGRTECLDNNQNSSNKSILFRNVQWADSGRYLCKLSIKNNNKSFRRKGNKTLLMIYGKYKVLDFSFLIYCRTKCSPSHFTNIQVYRVWLKLETGLG